MNVLSPAVQLLIHSHRLNVNLIKATGPKGHILKGDVLSFLQQPKEKERVSKADFILVNVMDGKNSLRFPLFLLADKAIKSLKPFSSIPLAQQAIPDISSFHSQEQSFFLDGTALYFMADLKQWSSIEKLSESLLELKKKIEDPVLLLL